MTSESSCILYHVFSDFYPATRIGGPIYCSIELILQLATKYPQKVLAFTTSVDRSEWFVTEDVKCTLSRGTTLCYLRHNLHSYLKLLRFVVRTASDASSSVLVLHGTYNPQYVFSFLISCFTKTKCVVIPHGTLSSSRRRNSKSWLVKRLSPLYNYLLLRNAYVLFSNENEITAAGLSDYDRSRFFTIPVFVPCCDESKWLTILSPVLAKNVNKLPDLGGLPGFDQLIHSLASFLSSTNYSRLNSGSQASPLLISYFGRLSPEKGLHNVIPYLARLYRTGLIMPLIIFGDGVDSSYVQSILSICSESKLPVYVTGFLERSLVLRLLQHLRPVLVFPSESDNFNLCLHEALAIGLQVFASDRINSVTNLSHFSSIDVLPYDCFGQALDDVVRNGLSFPLDMRSEHFSLKLKSFNSGLLSSYCDAFNSVLSAD